MYFPDAGFKIGDQLNDLNQEVLAKYFMPYRDLHYVTEGLTCSKSKI